MGHKHISVCLFVCIMKWALHTLRTLTKLKLWPRIPERVVSRHYFYTPRFGIRIRNAICQVSSRLTDQIERLRSWLRVTTFRSFEFGTLRVVLRKRLKRASAIHRSSIRNGRRARTNLCLVTLPARLQLTSWHFASDISPIRRYY